MNMRSVLLAATVLALPAGAVMAQPIVGPYVAGGAGYNWTQNTSFSSESHTIDGNYYKPYNGSRSLTSNGGLVGLASVGYGLGGGLRVELEGNYRGNSAKPQNGNYSNRTIDQFGAFVNGLYDFDLGPVNPYVGVGVGAEWTALDSKRYPGTAADGHTAYDYNFRGSHNANIAGQAILGVSIPVDVPGLSVTAEYRFLGIIGDTKSSATLDVGGKSYGVSGKLNDQYNHSFLIGLRYAFWTEEPALAAAPAPLPSRAIPAPVAAPAPAPIRTYLVFFDWDKADLTGRAKQIIAEAAQNSTRVQLTQIEVSGHADATGTAAYNLTLSRRRADNVAAELVRLGVPSNEIVIQAYGDTKPLVPTGPGVREPQNRRVEIVLK